MAIIDDKRLALKRARLEQARSQTVTKERVSEKGPDVSMTESGLRGAAQGASMGWADEITGGAQALGDLATGDSSFGNLDQAYTKHRDESRRAYEDAQSANPITYGAGDIAGGAATMLIPGLNAAKGASLAAMAGKAALQGAITGAGTTEKSGLGAVEDTALGGAMGGVLGGTLGYAGQKLAANPQTVGDAVQSFANEKAVASLGPTLKAQEKLNGMGLTQELGQELLDGGVVKFGRNQKGMAQPLVDLAEKHGRIIGEARDAAESLGARADLSHDAFLAREASLASHQTPDELIQSRFKRDQSKALYSDNMTPTDMVDAIERNNNSINFNKVPGTETPKEQAAIDLRKYLVGKLDGSMGEVLPEAQQAGQLKSKRFYSGLAQSEDILDKSIARGQKNVSGGLRSTIMASAATPKTGNGFIDMVATKGMSLVADQIGSRANSSVASIADTLAKQIKANPEKFGEFAPVLSQAMARGGTSLAATHYLLQQSNPKYRETVKLNEETP